MNGVVVQNRVSPVCNPDASRETSMRKGRRADLDVSRETAFSRSRYIAPCGTPSSEGLGEQGRVGHRRCSGIELDRIRPLREALPKRVPAAA